MEALEATVVMALTTSSAAAWNWLPLVSFAASCCLMAASSAATTWLSVGDDNAATAASNTLVIVAAPPLTVAGLLSLLFWARLLIMNQLREHYTGVLVLRSLEAD